MGYTLLEEKRIPDISEVKIIHDGRGIRIQFGNHTTYLDKRDLFNLPSWNDRKDNRDENLKRIEKERKERNKIE